MNRLTAAKRPKYPSTPLRELAVVDWTPREFSEKLGVPFETGIDDLDRFEYAAVKADGEPFFLLRYANSPDPGTELLGSMEADPEAAVQRFLEASGLSVDNVTWRTDAVAAPVPVIIEPANPFDVPRSRLRDLRDRLSAVLPADAPARLALRPEAGYGVNADQFIRVWIPDAFDQAHVSSIVDNLREWLRTLWEEDFHEHGESARTRGASIFDSNGSVLRNFEIRGADGKIVEHEPGGRTPLHRPVINNEDEESAR